MGVRSLLTGWFVSMICWPVNLRNAGLADAKIRLGCRFKGTSHVAIADQ